MATDPAAAPLELAVGAVESRTQRDGSRTSLQRGFDVFNTVRGMVEDFRGHVGDDNSSLGRPRGAQ